jgi:hypothetical protein
LESLHSVNVELDELRLIDRNNLMKARWGHYLAMLRYDHELIAGLVGEPLCAAL